MKRRAYASVVPLIAILLATIASFAPPLPTPASAQITSGRISGLVTDTTGHVIPAISVLLVQDATGMRRETTTDEGGFYVFTNVPIGSHAVHVSVPGFKPIVKTGHVLVADGRLTIDMMLEPGARTEAITVAAAGELINRTSGEIARVVDRTQVEALALAARSSAQLFTIIPGAPLIAVDPIGQTANSMATQPINGNRGDANNLMVDGGFNLSQANLGEVTSSVGLDFIQEVKLQTSNFSAEYGRQLGAAINIVTRAGANEFTGGASHFFRHEALDARHPFANATDSHDSAARQRLSHLGWTLGGPIRRGRLFFFGGQEWRRIRLDTTPMRRTLPTRAQRRGDFSGVPGALFHPGTGEPIAGRDLSSMITTEGRAIAAVYDAMERLAVSYVDQPIPNNAVFQPASEFDFRQDMARIDYQASDRHTFSGRYLHDAVRLRDPFGSNIESPLPNAPTVRERPTDGLLLSHAWVIAPSLAHELRVNLGWYRAHTFLQGDLWQRRTYGFSYPQVYSDGAYDHGIPDVTIAGYTGFKGPSATLWFDASDFTINETLTWQRRRHTLKAGALIVRAANDQLGRATDISTGAAVFDATDHPYTTGHAFADALLGRFRTYTEQSAMPLMQVRLLSGELFVSDNWRVSDRLGLEIGARYQRLRPLSALDDGLSTFDPALYDPARAVVVNADGTVAPGSGDPFNGMIRAGSGAPGAAADPRWEAVPAGAARTLWPARNRIAPRVSAAYALADDGRTSVRGGFGVFYETVRGDMTQRASANPPFLQVAQFEHGDFANPAYVAPPGQPAGLAPAASTGVLGSIAAVDRDMLPPSSTSYSVGLQRELTPGLIVEAAYVGNAGQHLTWRPDINRVPFETLAANAALPPDQRQSINALRPYKGYGSIRQYRAEARSNYNALQLHASRRRGDLHLTASYTWSKVLTDASSAITDPEDLDDRAFNYGPATFDRRHVFVGTYTWRMPWLRDREGISSAILGGWEVSGITRLQSGPWLTVTANTAIGVRRADVTGVPIELPRGERTSDRYFNTDAFARPPDHRRGTAGVGTVQGPGLQLWDVSLRKTVPVGRRVTARFQVDIFNALNHTNYQGLNTEVTSVALGSLSSAAPARSVQLGTRFSF